VFIVVFRSKVKEELFQELRQFIFWYHYELSKREVVSAVGFVKLSNRTYVRYKHTENHYISLDLVDGNRSLLFNLGFSFRTLNDRDYVTIDYMDKDGLGSTETFVLENSDGIVDFLIQMIDFIPSESYLKHYLNVFKNSIRIWLA
jgi:hypothetical protein